MSCRPSPERVCRSARRGRRCCAGSTTRRSRRCSSTRSCPGCTPRTAGRGWTPGSATAGSDRTTWSAVSCRADGPAAAAARCRSRRCCGGRSSPSRAGRSGGRRRRSAGAAHPGRAGRRRADGAGRRGRRPLRRPGRRLLRRRPRPGEGRDAGRAIYGATSGDAAPVLGVLRRRFPAAVAYVEAAARDGEAGRLVRSWLGRTCPPPSLVLARRRTGTRVGCPDAGDAGAVRERGELPGTAAGSPATSSSRPPPPTGPLVLLAALRRRLCRVPRRARRSCSSSTTRWSCTARRTSVTRRRDASRSGREASRLLFGDDAVRFPLERPVVDCYADAK